MYSRSSKLEVVSTPFVDLSFTNNCFLLSFNRHGYVRVGGVVGYRICLTHRRSSVRSWADSWFCFVIKAHDRKP